MARGLPVFSRMSIRIYQTELIDSVLHLIVAARLLSEVMAELFGIVAGAVGVSGVAADAISAILDIITRFTHAPETVQQLQLELGQLKDILSQIESVRQFQDGDPIERAVQSCNNELQQLLSRVKPLQQESGDGKATRHSKRLRMVLQDSAVKAAVGRLQSQKQTISLALLASLSGLVWARLFEKLEYLHWNSKAKAEESLRLHLSPVVGLKSE